MTSLPRLLVLIGSGETAAQMTRGHRTIAQRLAGEGGRPADVKATVIDTPYGFQSNADALTDGLVDFFGRKVGMPTTVASLRRADADVLAREAAFARIREADFVFAGPGSPSYALRNWASTEVPQLFADKLANGGALVLASAAALTAGRFTVPVYEIYKAGEDPYWLDGLDVLSTVGINAAVIPHWDNGEGGDHDTRFCFLGEEKLIALESELSAETLILGLDEHTALVIDLDAQVAAVFGRGGVTIRHLGESELFASGEVIPMDRLTASGAGGRSATPQPHGAADDNGDRQLARRLLDLEAENAAVDARAKLVQPLVKTLIELRSAARAAGDFKTADVIRDRLLELGVELSDAPDGTTTFRLDD